MKIRKYEISLILLFSLVSFPLISQTQFSSEKETAVSATKPFVKMIHSTGSLIQTIQDTRGGFVSISQFVSNGPKWNSNFSCKKSETIRRVNLGNCIGLSGE
jgi:hypothetical protein